MTSVQQPLSALQRFFSADFARISLEALDSLPVSLREFPTGWTSPWELTLLYNLVKHSSGPLRILEIGPWIGRSTTAISLGIRDRESRKDVLYDIVDFGITSGAEWEALLKVPYLNFAGQDQISRTIHAPGGSVAVLIENPRKLGLLEQVTSVIRGDCLQVPMRSSYDLIFCDCVHDAREIQQYGHLLADRLRPGGLLVCDDVIDPTLGKVLAGYVPFDFLIYLHQQDPGSKFCVGRKSVTPGATTMGAAA